MPGAAWFLAYSSKPGAPNCTIQKHKHGVCRFFGFGLTCLCVNVKSYGIHMRFPFVATAMLPVCQFSLVGPQCTYIYIGSVHMFLDVVWWHMCFVCCCRERPNAKPKGKRRNKTHWSLETFNLPIFNQEHTRKF